MLKYQPSYRAQAETDVVSILNITFTHSWKGLGSALHVTQYGQTQMRNGGRNVLREKEEKRKVEMAK